MAPSELEAFLATKGAKEAMRLRRYDDMGKDPRWLVPGGLDGFRRLIYEHLRERSALGLKSAPIQRVVSFRPEIRRHDGRVRSLGRSFLAS